MLDQSYIERAAPPGSMRYFALLYTPPEQREFIAAILVIDAEIRGSCQASHDVAHTRVAWWRAEVDRLVNRNAQHPATQTLQRALPHADFSVLHEALTAADMDLAKMSYNTRPELAAYLERSGGAVLQFASPVAPEAARKIGALIRRVETLRDLTREAREGRVYWPLDELDAAHITVADLQGGKVTPSLSDLIAKESAALHSEFDATESDSRPLVVLARLHTRLLRRMARAEYDVIIHRHELGALEKVWTAWRAARSS